MQRRDFLKLAAATAVTTLPTAKANSVLPDDIDTSRVRDYLRRIMPTRQQVENFIRREQGPEKLSRNNGWTFDWKLGWVLCDSVRTRSVDGSKGFYSYEADGARKVVNFPDRPSRIHTYGNSFTHCDQVSDGETWQEYLAAHIAEPIRNYGVGGYSVYQAYQRMLKVEKEDPAEYVILNIWDDDHFRNIDSWRAIRFGHRTPCGYTLPHLRVNITEKRIHQLSNMWLDPQGVYHLCDEEFVWKRFKDDPVLLAMLGIHGGREAAQKLLKPVADAFGISEEKYASLSPEQAIKKIHTEAALFSTRSVVTFTEQLVERTGKKLMLILSFGRGNIAADLKGAPRFDQGFVNWLKDKPYPVIDMRDAFRADYQQFKTDVNSYLGRYYIGHHNPAGNFFAAWAIKNRVVKWLDPSPLPYR